MNLTDALKWADTFGTIQSDPPTGDGPALLALAAEVRRLQAEKEQQPILKTSRVLGETT